MKARARRRKRIFRQVRTNLLVLLAFLVIGVASFHVLRTELLKNAKETGTALAKSYAAEERNNLTVYETLIAFGTEAIDWRVQEGESREELQSWITMYFQRLEDVLGEGTVDPYAILDGQVLAANPWDMVTSFQFNWLHIGLILIPILAGGVQLLMSVIMMKQQPQQNANAARSTKMMMYFMPLFSVYIAFLMPAALGVYWIAQSAFSLIQELVLNKFFKKRLEAEETAREEARQADRQKRIEEGRRQQEEQRKQAQTEKKQTLKEKQKAARAAKAAKAARAETSTTEAGRVGNRPYARGRAYRPDRYDEEV